MHLSPWKIVCYGWYICRGGKIFLPVPRVLGWDSTIITRLTREKQTSLLTCIPPVYMGDTKENWETPRGSPSHHPKHHLQLKTKERWRGSYVNQEKLTRVRLCRFKSVPCLLRVSCNLESSSYWSRGDSLTSGDFLYKCKFHIQKRNFGFQSFSSVCCFSKTISSK